MFKKHNWMSYGRKGDIVDIEITDSSGKKIDHFKTNDKKEYVKIIKLLKDKYGFNPEIDIEESPNFNKEVDWLE